MERDHKADQDRKQIAAAALPQLVPIIKEVFHLGEQSYLSTELQQRYAQWRIEYEEKLEEHFSKHEWPKLVSANPEWKNDEERRENERLNFTDDLLELDEEEAIRDFAAGDVEVERELATHFGTIRNNYLQNRDQAEQQSVSWVSSIKRGPEPSGGKSK